MRRKISIPIYLLILKSDNGGTVVYLSLGEDNAFNDGTVDFKSSEALKKEHLEFLIIVQICV